MIYLLDLENNCQSLLLNGRMVAVYNAACQAATGNVELTPLFNELVKATGFPHDRRSIQTNDTNFGLDETISALRAKTTREFGMRVLRSGEVVNSEQASSGIGVHARSIFAEALNAQFVTLAQAGLQVEMPGRCKQLARYILEEYGFATVDRRAYLFDSTYKLALETVHEQFNIDQFEGWGVHRFLAEIGFEVVNLASELVSAPNVSITLGEMKNAIPRSDSTWILRDGTEVRFTKRIDAEDSGNSPSLLRSLLSEPNVHRINCLRTVEHLVYDLQRIALAVLSEFDSLTVIDTESMREHPSLLPILQVASPGFDSNIWNGRSLEDFIGGHGGTVDRSTILMRATLVNGGTLMYTLKDIKHATHLCGRAWQLADGLAIVELK